jgi:hypothetical protein
MSSYEYAVNGKKKVLRNTRIAGPRLRKCACVYILIALVHIFKIKRSEQNNIKFTKII